MKKMLIVFLTAFSVNLFTSNVTVAEIERSILKKKTISPSSPNDVQKEPTPDKAVPLNVPSTGLHVEYFYRSKDEKYGTAHPLTNNSSLHEGDRIEIEFSTNDNAFVYLIAYDNKDREILFAQQTLSGKTYKLPASSYQVIELEGKERNREYLHWIFTDQEKPDLLSAYTELLQRGGNERVAVGAGGLTRSIPKLKEIPSNLQPNSRGTADGSCPQLPNVVCGSKFYFKRAD